MRRNLFELKAYDDLNVTPLLDLAWTLLVVFIIVVTASIQGIKVDLPKASTAPPLNKPKTKAITIDEKGQIYLDAYPMSLPELETRLRQHKSAEGDFPVVVKGDGKAYYQSIIAVLDMLQQIEITQLGLVTQKLTK